MQPLALVFISVALVLCGVPSPCLCSTCACAEQEEGPGGACSCCHKLLETEPSNCSGACCATSHDSAKACCTHSDEGEKADQSATDSCRCGGKREAQPNSTSPEKGSEQVQKTITYALPVWSLAHSLLPTAAASRIHSLASTSEEGGLPLYLITHSLLC